MRVFVDADVLIWHLRGEGRATAFLKQLRSSPGSELWTGALQRAEVLFYARQEEESTTLQLLGLLRTAPVTEAVVDLAAALFRRWKPSHDVSVADAILAATSVKASGRIVTLNTRHFPMPEVAVDRAWE